MAHGSWTKHVDSGGTCPNLAPPGYYYIHIINSFGIPSAARIITIPGAGTSDGGGEHGGGGTTGEIFNNVSSPGNAVAGVYSGGNPRYGEEARRSSSMLVGKSLKSWTVRLRRAGSASGTVRAVVRTSSDTIVATFNETIDASSLPTSFIAQTFTLANAYTQMGQDAGRV